MAIVKFGQLVVGVRGTIAGVTYSRNKGSVYAKHWHRSSNPRTVRQQKERGRMATLAKMWEDLSEEQRQNWRDLAATDPEPVTNQFGEPIELSGFNLFVMLNRRRMRRDLDPRQNAPEGTDATRPAPPSIIDVTFYGSPPNALEEYFCFVEWDDTEDPHSGDVVGLKAGFSKTLGSCTPQIGPVYGAAVEFSEGFGFLCWMTAFDRLGAPLGWRGFLYPFRERPSGLRSIPQTLTAPLEER